MAEKATKIEEQISKLKSRGLTISDEKKTKEYLLDIGYYRLGFYLFPFEKSYPRKTNRDHQYKYGTDIEFAIALYYFDDDLRHVLLKYISRIEINFRTKLIYEVSNQYNDNPFWFLDDSVVDSRLIENEKYKKEIKKISDEEVIKIDFRAHSRKNAPAWKTIEFFSFGTIINIFDNLKDKKLKHTISQYYGLNQTQLSNYLKTLKKIRNNCAHGKVIFDMTLPCAISSGPAGNLIGEQKTSIYGAYKVLSYMIEKISVNRRADMDESIKEIFSDVKYDIVKKIIENNLGFINSL